MNDQDKCPFCGSEQLLTATPDYIWWRCGTIKAGELHTEQSTICRNIERDALKSRIAQLEEALLDKKVECFNQKVRIAQLEEAVGLAMKMRRDWLSLQNEGCAGAYEAFVEGMGADWDKIAKAMEVKP